MSAGWFLVAATAAAALVLSVPQVSADGDFGPDTCLNGWVWREAVSTDHVCVSLGVRTQTQQDNALAASRRSATGGPFGPDTCLQGFVWREAVPGDHVCVLPDTRVQAQDDNVHAAERRDEIRIKVGTYGAPLLYLVQADRINLGTASVLLYRTGSSTPKKWTQTAKSNPTGLPGGQIVVKTGVRRCSGRINAYFQVRDSLSTRLSSPVKVCTV